SRRTVLHPSRFRRLQKTLPRRPNIALAPPEPDPLPRGPVSRRCASTSLASLAGSALPCFELLLSEYVKWSLMINNDAHGMRCGVLWPRLIYILGTGLDENQMACRCAGRSCSRNSHIDT